jgi:hypothetical protein
MGDVPGAGATAVMGGFFSVSEEKNVMGVDISKIQIQVFKTGLHIRSPIEKLLYGSADLLAAHANRCVARCSKARLSS